ncbi:MAG: Ca-activated chloride channel [Acidobacteriota bacterium]|jgi:VWFA-related protein|nr:Ca-activated chloride channel [Acidobacteriota bacterium]
MMLSYLAPDRSNFPRCHSSRSSFVILLFIPFLFYASSISVFAQTDELTDDVVRVRTDLVTVPAFVRDTKGRRISGLTQSDFTVYDNKQTVTLSYFAAGTEHVALAFALDTSGSIREVISQQREAALALFSRFGHGSRVAVLHFGEKAALTVPFTTDASVAQSAFGVHTSPNQHTAIFDAAAAAVHAFITPGSNLAERRILILISDGLDTASTVRAAEVINEARSSAVSIYVIHLPLFTPRDGQLIPRPASKGFRELAEKTGGRYFMVGDAKSALNPQAVPDLAPVFQAIEEDLQGQYVLGFYPDDAARQTSLHRIEINLTQRNARKLHVQPLREEYNLKQ